MNSSYKKIGDVCGGVMVYKALLNKAVRETAVHSPLQGKPFVDSPRRQIDTSKSGIYVTETGTTLLPTQ